MYIQQLNVYSVCKIETWFPCTCACLSSVDSWAGNVVKGQFLCSVSLRRCRCVEEVPLGQHTNDVTVLWLQVPNIVKALHKQMKEKSVKTRQCCFNMLTELVNVLPGALTQHIPVLVPGASLGTYYSLFVCGTYRSLNKCFTYKRSLW